MAEWHEFHTSTRRRRCGSENGRSDCLHGINTGDRYCRTSITPNGELGNETWWNTDLCIPCAGNYGHVDPGATPRLKALPEDVVAELRSLYAHARTVNGSTPVDSPARAASVELSARLADLNAAGYGCKSLGVALGADRTTIRSRLGRHGHRQLPPSQANNPYRGIQGRQYVAAAARKAELASTEQVTR